MRVMYCILALVSLTSCKEGVNVSPEMKQIATGNYVCSKQLYSGVSETYAICKTQEECNKICACLYVSIQNTKAVDCTK